MAADPREPTEPTPRDPIAGARAAGYSEAEIASVPAEVVLGMGCGNPVALATLAEGEVVLDLGCGGGFDCLLAAARVGPTGRVIGVDSSGEALEIARTAVGRQGCTHVEFRLGKVEALPLSDASVDVVMSNCVLSDVTDRGAAFREAARVLRPGGRVMISDLVLTQAPPDGLSGVPEVWAGWLAHAPTLEEYLQEMVAGGLREVAVVEQRGYSSPGAPPEMLAGIASILVRAVR